MNTSSNDIVVKALKKRESWALKHLYDSYWERMLVYAHKIIYDQQQCEDIIQEIFVNLWENAPKRDIRQIESYLFKALKYKIANSLRDSKYIPLKEEHISRLPCEHTNSTEIELHELETQVQQVMETLPLKCQNVFYLSRVKQYNNKEIAQQLNISIRTVETHISNALKHFKVHLNYLIIILIWVH